MSIPHGFRLWSASLVVFIGAVVGDKASGQPKPVPLAAARPTRVDVFGDTGRQSDKDIGCRARYITNHQ